jgi:hypothetical protein
VWWRGQLTYSDRIYKKRKWYISHELLLFEPQSAKGYRGTRKFVVWENLILIKARSPEEAYRKALKHGRLNEEKVKIDGEEGRCKFKGLRDLVLVYDELEDGAELEWHDLRKGVSELVRMVKPKRQMQAFNVGPTKE